MMAEKTKDQFMKELRAKATGDFKKFNDETLKAIDDAENFRDLTEYESLEEMKKAYDIDE
ncbi:MAG: hypothetical protein IEMM0008_1786 [bacterium]|nr:MAG: hypothetical protein IEMM0008_1786 [bacterium]